MHDTSAAPLPETHTLYSPGQRRWFLAVLFLVSTSNYADRQIISIVLEPIKREFGVSDTMLGLLTGFSFAIFYATLGIPVARLADRSNRRIIIGVSLTIWSVMTVVCGLAQQFWQLVLARVGVGAGEAGAIPPAQSLLADYFPPEQRGRALGIFMMSGMAGYLIAFIGGSQIASHFGWRSAFIVLGLPGLLLALLVFLQLDEPRARPGRKVDLRTRESFIVSWRALAAKPGFVNLAMAMTLYFLIAYGALVFVPSFIIRLHGIDLKSIGVSYGIISAIGSIAGSVMGGFAVDRLVRRDRRWMCWTPALLMALAAPFQIAAFLMPTYPAFLAISLLSGLLLAAGVPTLFTHLHAICGSPRRATAVALMFFFANLVGLGFGPLLAGALSDHFSSRLGPEGLRWALALVTSLLLPAGWFMARAARTLGTDTES